jgi:hypothetical protein
VKDLSTWNWQTRMLTILKFAISKENYLNNVNMKKAKGGRKIISHMFMYINFG